MAAGQGFKTFVTGEVLTAGDVNGYLMQGINVFATTAARDAAITAPAEGQFAFTKDTNSLWYYDGAAWVASGATGDIEGVTAGIGISGGGTSGTVTVTNSMATAIDAKGDLVAGTGADAFSRLGVGANNTVLTADSAEATGLKWATPSVSGTSWTLLNAGGTALTAAQTITVSGISSKNDLFIIVTGASSATAQSEIRFRFNGDTATNYASFGIQNANPTTYSATQTFNAENQTSISSIRLAQMSNVVASTVSGYLLVSGANTAGIKQVSGVGGSNPSTGNSGAQYALGGYWSGAATITSVSINSEFGNFDAGTIYVYTSA